MTDSEALRRIVAEGHEFTHPECELDAKSIGHWFKDNGYILLSALEERAPPAGQDQRVGEIVKRLRSFYGSSEPLTGDEVLCHQAADLLEFLAAWLAEADAMIAEMQPRYQHDCNYCQGNTRICERSPRGGCLLRKEQFARHVARGQK